MTAADERDYAEEAANAADMLAEAEAELAANTYACEWFARCDHEATTLRPHPILGYVPICSRCNDRAELQ